MAWHRSVVGSLGLALLAAVPFDPIGADPPPRPGAAVFSEVKVYFRVLSARMERGCVDAFCTKPDFFMAVGTGSGAQAPVFVTPVVPDIMYVDPAPPTWSGGPFTVARPARLTIDLFDADGPATDRAGDGSIEDDLTSVREAVDIRTGPGTNVTLDLEPLIGIGEQTLSFTGENATVRVAVLVELIPGRLTNLALSTTSYRPSDGGTVTMTGTGTGGAALTFTVFGPTGIAFTGGATLPAGSTTASASASATWNGRLPNGSFAPAGQYRVEVAGFDPAPSFGSRARTIPEAISQTLTILAPAATPTLTFLGLDPGNQWSPESGPLLARVASNSNLTIGSRIFDGGFCSGSQQAVGGSASLTAGSMGTISWNGRLPAGTFLGVGGYSLQLFATNPAGAVNPICVPFSVIALGPPLVIVQHAPFLASPGQTVTFTARSVDADGKPRRVATLTVSAQVGIVGLPAPAAGAPPLATCPNATTCTATLTLPPMVASRMAWKGDVLDASGTITVSSGWRGQRVTNWSTVSGTLGSVAIAVDEALPGPLAINPIVDHARGWDLVFNVSNEFRWSDAADLGLIGSSLDGFMMRLWGLEGFDTPAGTTFLARPDLVSVYLNPEQTQVTWAGSANECDWSAPGVAWADARGVLHRTPCRDNASFFTRSFSAKLGSRDVILHELHHALFGLADEYANTTTAAGIGGDGGYSTSAELPNVFTNLADCVAVPGRPPGGCTMINEVERGSVPLRFSGRVFFRLDDPALLDIMDANGRQRFADIRQAKFREARCAAADC